MVANKVVISASIVLIQGGESVLADRAVSEILKARAGSEVTQLDGATVEIGQFADATAPSLFSESRILVIKDMQDLVMDVQEEVERYLAEPDPELLLVFTHKGGVKGKALLEKVKKLKPEIITCEPIKKESEKLDFVRGEFNRLHRKIENDAVQALVDALGSDIRELTGVCSQIAFDTPNPKAAITVADVNKYQQGRVETTGFDVADATLDGNPEAALIALRNALATGTDPVMITSALASAIRNLAKVSGAPRGAKSFELAGSLGLAPWQIDKARRQLNNWSPAAIVHAVQEVATADAAVKGAAVDPIYALERAISAIATGRKKASLSLS